MNKDDLIDSLGGMDEDMIREVGMLRQKDQKRIWVRWAAMAACFALTTAICLFAVEHIPTNTPSTTEPSGEPSGTLPIQHTKPSVETGIYVNGMLFMPDSGLSKRAAGKNVGAPIGNVSFHIGYVTDIPAFAYLPDDGVTNRVIVPYDGAYYVYAFYAYLPDGTESWPIKLLENADYIEIRDPNYGSLNETVYLTISDEDVVTELLTVFAGLKQKYTHIALNQYYFEMFRDQFQEGEIWINADGGIAHGGNADVSMKFSRLVGGDCREIAVIMKDNTALLYLYQEGAGVILCDDFGYILTDAQAKQIDHLIGLA